MQQFFQSLARIEAGLAVLAIELRENLQCRKRGLAASRMSIHQVKRTRLLAG
ncbi:MAG: hypothetical protein V3T39_09105 [Gammaproteobacteria bacterium]